MIDGSDDPFGLLEVPEDCGGARAIYGAHALDELSATLVSRTGAVFTYDRRTGRVGDMRTPFVTSRGKQLRVHVTSANGPGSLLLQRAVALAWFHSGSNWRRSKVRVCDEGRVLGMTPATPPPPRARRGAHVRTYVTKYNSVSWFCGGAVEVNGARVSGVLCMGELFCWLPNEGPAKLCVLALRARGDIRRGPVDVTYIDGDACNLDQANLRATAAEESALPPRFKGLLRAFADGVAFEDAAPRLGVKLSTAYAYASHILRFHMRTRSAGEAREFVAWVVGTDSLVETADTPYAVKRVLGTWRKACAHL